MTNYQNQKVTKEHPDVLRVLELETVKDYAKSHELDLDSIQLNEFHGQDDYSIVIPLKTDHTTVVLAALNKNDVHRLSVQLLTVEQVKNNVEISFSDLEQASFTKGVYGQGFELLKVESHLNGETLAAQDAASCLMDVFKRMPWWLQSACEGVCAGCLGGLLPACAACAGCIGGTALRCI
ncbi:hypothetical protein [Bacillus cereus]|uniref:hypothetical protein n=1 Tax=Bacillus cereus TaxID=1396 RepID=UPI000BEC96AB|nr:hypothetical protein [Bacillus cereus]PDY77414.1 hypothetical protein CON06_26845 [Bacillus cereus]PFA13192.1 hypothetical protein CN382_13990 [Bacillus cereus]PFM33692.1 hypothetical protein COJ43_25440 [Bacillus cereus]